MGSCQVHCVGCISVENVKKAEIKAYSILLHR